MRYLVPNVIPFYAMTWSRRELRYDFRNYGTKHRASDILTIDLDFWYCVTEQFMSANRAASFLLNIISTTLPVAMLVLKFIHGTHFRYPCIILLY